MSALKQIQEIISSLQTVKQKLSLVISSQRSQKRDQDKNSFSDKILTSISPHVQNFVSLFQSSFLEPINRIFQSYHLRSGELIQIKNFDIQDKQNSTFNGEDFRHFKLYLATQSQDISKQPILSPKFQQQLNRSMGAIDKSQKSKDSQIKLSKVDSKQSFFTAIEGQNFQDIKNKFINPRNFETGSLKDDIVKVKSFAPQSSENFQSIANQSSYKTVIEVKKFEKQTQTLRKPFELQKFESVRIEQKAKPKKSPNKTKKSSKQNDSDLVEIIYGKRLIPFIKFYLKNIKQHPQKSTSNSVEHIQKSENLLNDGSKTLKENTLIEQMKNQEKQNPLLKYITKGNSLDEISQDEVIQAKFQRLVVICLDTLLHTMKILQYFLPGSLSELISSIKQQQLMTFKSRCLGSREAQIQKVCKKVTKKIISLRTELKEYDAKKLIFNKDHNIKVTLKSPEEE